MIFFPSSHILHNFSLSNSNLICQSNVEFILNQIKKKIEQHVLLKCLIALCVNLCSFLMFCYTKHASPVFPVRLCVISGVSRNPIPPLTQTHHNSNSFQFPLKVRVIWSQLYLSLTDENFDFSSLRFQDVNTVLNQNCIVIVLDEFTPFLIFNG